MKIRNGFVSNSSSASFIVKWKSKYTDISTLEEAIDYFRGQKLLYDGSLQIFIQENTEVLGNGWFETNNYTVMMNSIEDFNKNILALVALLSTTNQFEYKTEIEADD